MQDLLDIIEWTNLMHIRGDPEGEEREKEAEILLREIIAENFSTLQRDIDIQMPEAQKNPRKINPKKITLGTV